MRHSTPRSLRAAAPLLAWICLAGAGGSGAAAQVPAPAVGPTVAATDSVDLVRDLERAVDDYERSRRRHAPADWFPRTGGDCDQYIGRMCITLGEGSDWWFPEERPERMEEERQRLLSRLLEGVRTLPGDDWILGQLVRYLGEGGEWAFAERYVDPCPPVQRYWCLALRGTVLHGSGRYVEAESAFRRALGFMPEEEARGWLAPGHVVRAELDDLLEEFEEAGDTAAHDALVERFWRFSDPFLLVEGNDRLTEHLARRTLVQAQYGRDSAYRVRFRDDLAEVTIRYGWEVGWERRPSSVTALGSESTVTGHQHPYSLPWAAPERAVLDPAASTARDWVPQSARVPRTGYAPLYAPNTLPDGEILLFPRGREAVVAAAVSMPPDTSWHVGHGHPPLPLLATFAGRPATSGLFALDSAGRLAAEDRRTLPTLIGAEREEVIDLLPEPTWHEVTLPVGAYVVSVEHVVPGVARGARHRRGVRVERRLLDQPTLSDLLLLPGAGPDPATLEEALDGLALRSVAPGERVRVGWETWGLGRREETFAYTIVLAEEGGGVIDRIAGWLGLGGDGVVSELSWTERAPERLGAHFRSIAVETPSDLEPGDYRLRLELRTEGREPLVSERALRVRS